MSDPWSGRVRLWQTSPAVPADRCDLALVEVRGQKLVALVVDGAPGRASARPPWPREAIFDAAGYAFGSRSEPEETLQLLSERLRSAVHGKAWRLGAAAVAISWDAASGWIVLAEAGDTKAWLVRNSAPTPVIEGGLPARGRTPANMLGDVTPDIRSRIFHFSDVGQDVCLGLALITDGGYDILRSPTLGLPGELGAWTIDTVGIDDATLLLVTPPVSSR